MQFEHRPRASVISLARSLTRVIVSILKRVGGRLRAMLNAGTCEPLVARVNQFERF